MEEKYRLILEQFTIQKINDFNSHKDNSYDFELDFEIDEEIVARKYADVDIKILTGILQLPLPLPNVVFPVIGKSMYDNFSIKIKWMMKTKNECQCDLCLDNDTRKFNTVCCEICKYSICDYCFNKLQDKICPQCRKDLPNIDLKKHLIRNIEIMEVIKLYKKNKTSKIKVKLLIALIYDFIESMYDLKEILRCLSSDDYFIGFLFRHTDIRVSKIKDIINSKIKVRTLD